jgi:hypothetical protein
VSDTAGEWFEVYNPTNSDLELKDQIVTDGGAQHFTISRSLVIPAGGFLVLGNNGDKKTNGGVPVAFVYTGFTLANAGDAIQIMNSTTTIDSVRYDASFGVTAGRAISLDPRAFNTTANDTGTNWCAAVLQMPGGDFGSPGSLNPQLPVTWYWTQRKTTTHPKTGQVANTQTSYFPGGMTAQAAYQFWSVIPINDGTQESNETVQFRGIGSSGYCINNTLSASGVFSIVNSGPATNPFRMNSNHDILEAF